MKEPGGSALEMSWRGLLEDYKECLLCSSEWITGDEIEEVEHNIRVKEALMSALIDSEMTNVMGLQTTHEIWEKLQTLYEGDKQVKVAKLQSLKGKYEMLKMGEDENINTFIAKVNDLVLGIRCVDGTLVEDEIVAKVLRYLPHAYKYKVAAINEIQSVTTVTRDMSIGKIVAFELSECGESHGKFETTFRASISGKKKYDHDERRISRQEEKGEKWKSKKQNQMNSKH